MNHFADQNGPFCQVKRPILKNGKEKTSKLYNLFTISEAFKLLE
jgi:hypothetical protein